MYHERSGILEEVDKAEEVDLSSEALQIWQSAINANPELEKIIENLPKVVYATREHQPTTRDPEGVLVYLRTENGIDALAWIDKEGNSVTQSQSRILRMAKCSIDTPPLPRHPQHYELVARGAELIAEQTKIVVATLGNKLSIATRVYDRLMAYVQNIRKNTPLLAMETKWKNLELAIEEISQYPLKQNAIANLNQKLKAGINDKELADSVISLREQNELCVINSDKQYGVQIICSMEIFSGIN